MAEQWPCFQPGFDFLKVENSDHVYFIKGIFKNTRELREAVAFGSCFSALLSCSWKFPRAYTTQQCTRRVFYFFIKILLIIFIDNTDWISCHKFSNNLKTVTSSDVWWVLEAHGFPRASLSANCSLLGTDNVRGQISEHIFARNEGYCLYIITWLIIIIVVYCHYKI